MTNSEQRPLYFFLIATLGVGALASFFSQPAIVGWYAGLTKPWYDPPNWLFAPIWTTLYVLMAVAAWRVWRLTDLSAPEIGLYGAQLALNLGWSVTFFGLHRIAAALGVLGVLFLLIAVLLGLFWRRDPWAGFMLAPYLAWTGFAAFLNFAIWQLNS